MPGNVFISPPIICISCSLYYDFAAQDIFTSIRVWELQICTELEILDFPYNTGFLLMYTLCFVFCPNETAWKYSRMFSQIIYGCVRMMKQREMMCFTRIDILILKMFPKLHDAFCMHRYIHFQNVSKLNKLLCEVCVVGNITLNVFTL